MIAWQRPVAVALAATLLGGPLSATCGGGGGGGLGGVAPDGGRPEVYRVAWKVLPPGAAPPKAPDAALVLYWFPTSPQEARSSALQTSRALSLAGARCVATVIVTTDNKPVRDTFKAPESEPLAVLAGPDGAELGRVPAEKGALSARPVEKLLLGELDRQEDETKAWIKDADRKADAHDTQAAIDELHKAWERRCLFPSLGKKAAKALKALHAPVEESQLLPLGADGLADPDVRGIRKDVEATLRRGLDAELGAHYRDAEKLYAKAVELDPADPTALRYLGELYRHQTGEWDKARVFFDRVLHQPADPIARAVALHGLGKMTIHAGRYADGLSLFEQSLAAFPLPITYRNLAVYWFSEKQPEKAAGFMRQAIALEPDDRYNQIFAAVYLAAAGHKEEALRIARENESVLEASYNLAAIWAQAGDTKKAMELLRRHFYEYERFDAVRAMEMQEARDDYMFAAMHQARDFVDLTHLATRHGMQP